jgi:endo-1,4-beta-D-glucanase Y
MYAIRIRKKKEKHCIRHLASEWAPRKKKEKTDRASQCFMCPLDSCLFVLWLGIAASANRAVCFILQARKHVVPPVDE